MGVGWFVTDCDWQTDPCERRAVRSACKQQTRSTGGVRLEQRERVRMCLEVRVDM